MKLCVNFLECPGKSLGVLAHFKTGCCNTAGICSLSRAVKHLVLEVNINSFWSRRHVSTLRYSIASVCSKFLSTVCINLVLGSTWKSNITLDAPDTTASLCICSICMGGSFNILFDTSALNLFDLLNNRKINSVWIVNISVRIRKSNNLSTELSSLLCSVDSYVTGTGDNNSLILEALAVCFQHLFCEVAETKTCSFCTSEGTTIGKTLTGKYTRPLIADSLVLSEHVTDLTSACSDIAGRYVAVRTDVLAKLSHEALAETHYFSVALTLRVEVGTTFAAAHRKSSKAVLKDLLETEELDDTAVYRRVKSETSLVWSDS